MCDANVTRSIRVQGCGIGRFDGEVCVEIGPKHELNRVRQSRDTLFRDLQFFKMSVLSRFAAFTNRHPVVRGMISYATIWPTSCIIQQTIAGKSIDNYDWMQALRFSLYGGLFTAPTLYAWVRVATMVWPKTNLKTGVTKVRVAVVGGECRQCCLRPWWNK